MNHRSILSAPACLAIAASSAILLPSQMKAALLVYEGFEGYASGQLTGQTASSNTVGLTGSYVTNGGAESLYSYSSSGLTFGSLPTSGGRGEYGTSGAPAFLGLTYDGPTATGDLYLSFLANIQGGLNTGSAVAARSSATASTGTAGAFYQSFLDTNTGTSPGAAHQRNVITSTMGGGTVAENPIATGETFLVVGRFTNVGQAPTVENPGVATTYVLRLNQYETLVANGGVTDLALDSATIGTGPFDIYARISNTRTSGTADAFTSGIGIQFSVGNAQAAQTVYFDELRYATTVGEVAPVPEPASGVFLGAGAAMMAGFRRRRRA